MSERTLIARWESDGGKYWVELYNEQWGYTYDASSGGGSLGGDVTTDQQATAWMEERTVSWTQSRTGGYFHPGKRPMRRTDTESE